MQNSCLTCFSFQSLNILFYCHLVSMIFDGKYTVNLLEKPFEQPLMWSIAFLLLLSSFSPSLSFSSLRIIYHDVDFFEFVLLGVCWGSCAQSLSRVRLCDPRCLLGNDIYERKKAEEDWMEEEVLVNPREGSETSTALQSIPHWSKMVGPVYSPLFLFTCKLLVILQFSV